MAIQAPTNNHEQQPQLAVASGGNNGGSASGLGNDGGGGGGGKNNNPERNQNDEAAVPVVPVLKLTDNADAEALAIAAGKVKFRKRELEAAQRHYNNRVAKEGNEFDQLQLPDWSNGFLGATEHQINEMKKHKEMVDKKIALRKQEKKTNERKKQTLKLYGWYHCLFPIVIGCIIYYHNLHYYDSNTTTKASSDDNDASSTVSKY